MTGLRGPLCRACFSFVILTVLLSACSLPLPPIPVVGPTTVSTFEPTQFPVSTPSPAAAAPRSLTVCLGSEPNTLYPFGEPNDAGQSVLAAIDDGPIDTVNYDYQPVILTSLPSLSGGDARILPVQVSPGSKIVDASGTLTALEAGARVRPSSCRSDDCIITYDGVSP